MAGLPVSPLLHAKVNPPTPPPTVAVTSTELLMQVMLPEGVALSVMTGGCVMTTVAVAVPLPALPVAVTV